MRAWSQKRPAAVPRQTHLPVRPFGLDPVLQAGGATEGPGAGDPVDRAARFGHSLASFSVSEGTGTVQRKILRPGTNNSYARLDGRVPWFKALSPTEQQAVLALHGQPKTYTPDEAVALVRSPPTPTATTASTTPKTADPFDYSDNDSEEESDVDEVNQHWTDKSLKLLQKGPDFFEDSSDSEEELGPKPDKEVLERRRKYKAGQLEAIARTAYPTSPTEKTKFEDLQKLRKKGFEDRPKKRGKYGKEAQKALMERGLDMKKTNLGHNSYLRRAFRKSVSESQMKTGTSKLYNQKQGDIRKKLQQVIEEDHESMKWEEKDFSSPKMWKTVKNMTTNVVSNDKKKRRFQDMLDSDVDLKDGSQLGAFHHEGWKESLKSLGKPFEPHALNPLNLTLRHDERERKNDSSIIPGAHEYDHQSGGFKTTDDWAKERSQGGGHFVDLDSEATYFILKGIGGKRESKRDLYGMPPKKKLKPNPS